MTFFLNDIFFVNFLNQILCQFFFEWCLKNNFFSYKTALNLAEDQKHYSIITLLLNPKEELLKLKAVDELQAKEMRINELIQENERLKARIKELESKK